MKPLVKKILEAGLVDKHSAKMFEQWGHLEPGAADIVGKKEITDKTLESFAEDIEALLEAEADKMRETRLEAHVLPPCEYFCELGPFAAVEDHMGNLIVSPELNITRGLKVSKGREIWELDYKEVLDVEPLYQGDKLIAKQVRLG